MQGKLPFETRWDRLEYKGFKAELLLIYHRAVGRDPRRSRGTVLAVGRRIRAGAAPAVRVARVVGVLAAVADAVVRVASAEQQVPPPCYHRQRNCTKASVLSARKITAKNLNIDINLNIDTRIGFDINKELVT